MKRWIAILLAACLLTGPMALAEDAATEAATEATEAATAEPTAEPEAADAEPTAASTKLPAPEEVAELEGVEPEGAEAVPEDGDAADVPDTEEPVEETAGEAGTFEVWFEEGFALTLNEGWVSYAVADEDREGGIRYALGDGSGARNLYIQITPTRLADTDALAEAVENTEGLARTGVLTFGGVDFVAFIDARQNASCCAALVGGSQVVFAFTPQSDADFMLTASQLMETFTVL